jgi:triacylglycerol esterase/lipase EstA (alpha/beta hydrolase family)
MGRRGHNFARIALLAALLICALGATSASAKFAPLDRKGPNPAKHVSAAKLKASVTCSPGIRNADVEPVLLFPATGVDSEHNFSWNYERLFNQQGIPWCASDQAGKRSTNMDNIWVRSYYVAYAIRKVHRVAGRKIALVGHSQGGMIMRIGLRFWPDTRKMVDDVIGYAGTNNGTEMSDATSAQPTPPANRQQASNSRYTHALNSRAQTFKGISYTENFTNLDEVVTPQPGASSVAGPGKITNVAIQDVCPATTAEHLQIGTSDPAAAALTLDALGHKGPAKPSRIDTATVCSQQYQPGVNPTTYVADVTNAASQLVASQAYPGTTSEAKIPCWAKLYSKACRKNHPGGSN